MICVDTEHFSDICPKRKDRVKAHAMAANDSTWPDQGGPNSEATPEEEKSKQLSGLHTL